MSRCIGILLLSLTVTVTWIDVTLSSQWQAVRPYMGWSSWSLQATHFPGYGFDWLREENVLRQIDVMAEKLLPFGYNYINLDSGWSGSWDEHGRPQPDAVKFPNGIKFLADYAHERGLKLGIYQPVGLQMGVFGHDQSNKINFEVAGAPNCTGFDMAYPDWRVTNGWDSAYKMDFDSNSCAAIFTDTVAQQFADWGIDFLKLDGIGPGSWKSGPNYDNRPDVAAWRTALNKTGRQILFELSWELDIEAVDTWTAYADGWRINTDVECYCDTLVRWTQSVVQRWSELPPWIQHAGPGRWNDLDSLNIGNGTMDGINEDERRSYATLWAISNSPFYIGDDLTLLDEYGMELYTNREVIEINQHGMPAKPTRSDWVDQQVWWSKSDDDSYVVALFNLGEEDALVTAIWLDFGFLGSANVRDVWAGEELGAFSNGFSDRLRPHATRLLRITVN